MPRAGIVTLAGRPNAGKSTLLNRLIGEHLSITSPKPQSTRDRIVGILSRETPEPTQIIFFDTPGLLEPNDELQRTMRSAARSALADADVILYVADATRGVPESLPVAAALETPPRAPVVTALNKVDRLTPPVRAALQRDVPGAYQISATTGEGIDALLDVLTAQLPESPFLYGVDDVSTQPIRFFAAEFIREAALEQLSEEVPYSVAVNIEEFREQGTPAYIRAIVYVEHDSQKGILVGHNGGRIRDLGRAARLKIERLIQAPVYLDLRVKVLSNWRRDRNALRRLGYGGELGRST
jgi:GTPase